MSDFKSKSFNVSSARTQPMREFNVENPDMPMHQQPSVPSSEVEEQMRQARRAKQESANKVSAFGKKRLELFTNIGRLTVDVPIKDGDHTIVFSLRTLKDKEAKEATIAAIENSVNNAEIGFETRKQQLARSIYKVDGFDIADALETDSFEARLQAIEVMEDSLVSKLFEEFLLLKKRAVDQYSVKTEKEAKEVANDLKK